MTMVSPERFASEGHDVLARLRHVFKVYRVGDTGVVALGGVDLDVPRGEFLPPATGFPVAEVRGFPVVGVPAASSQIGGDVRG